MCLPVDSALSVCLKPLHLPTCDVLTTRCPIKFSRCGDLKRRMKIDVFVASRLPWFLVLQRAGKSFSVSTDLKTLIILSI